MPLVGTMSLLDIALDVAIFSAFIAVAYLLLLWAAQVLVKYPLQGIANRVPFVGGFFSGVIGFIVDDVIGFARGWADNAVYPLVRFINNLAQLAIAAVDMLVGSVEWVLGRIIDLYKQLVRIEGTLTADVFALWQGIARVVAVSASLATTVGNLIIRVDYLVATWIPNAIAAAVNAVAHAAAVALADAVKSITTALTALQRALAAAIAEFEAAVTAIDNTLTREIWPAIDNLRGVIPWLVASVTALVGANLITRVATLELDVAAEVECVTTTCAGLGPYMNMLNLLQTTETLIVIAAAVEVCVADPEGAAREVAAAAGTLESIAGALASPFTGGRL